MHFFDTGLTKAEAERLHMLGEEGSEVAVAVSKTNRHGFQSYNPFDPKQVLNREALRQECIDVLAMIQIATNHGDINPITPDEIQQRMQKKLRYTHFQEDAVKWGFNDPSILAPLSSEPPSQA